MINYVFNFRGFGLLQKLPITKNSNITVVLITEFTVMQSGVNIETICTQSSTVSPATPQYWLIGLNCKLLSLMYTICIQNSFWHQNCSI